MLLKIKDHVASASGRTKGIMIIGVIYLIVVFASVSVGAMNKISDYLPTVSISFQDGVDEKKTYLVQQDTVKNVLSQLEVTLDKSDKVNKDMDETVQDQDFIKITRVFTKTVVKEESVDYDTVMKSTGLYGSKVTTKGKKGTIKNTYLITYANNKEISKKIIGSKVVEEAQDEIRTAANSVAEGGTFSGRLTTYGGDCSGCGGTASSGVKLSPTSGVNHSNSPYLTYKGDKYYCLAADRSIPFGTIVEITNSGIRGGAIRGIVVDRGGAIKGTHFDIFKGSESGGYFSGGSSNAHYKIISVGSGNASFWR